MGSMILLMLVVCQQESGSSTPEVERLRREGPASWKKLLSKSSPCEGKTVVKLPGPPSGNPEVQTEEFGIETGGGYVIVQNTRESRAIGVNDQYHFEVKKNNDKWIVVSFGLNNASNAAVIEKLQSALSPPNSLLVSISPGITLESLIADRSVKVRYLGAEGDYLRYEIVPGDLGRGMPRIDRIEVTLDPGEFWIIKSLMFTERQGALMTTADLKTSNRGGIPVLISRVTLGKVTTPDGQQMEVASSEQIEQSLGIAKRDFPRNTLSAYGLPEPPGTTVMKNGISYWLLGAIGGTLLVGLGFYLRSRRAAS
jgi:hypothetical protein